MSMIGKTLGHYSLSTLLGMGGMGEVYKAKDQKLGRDVAIKVLPEEFAKDADRVARFQREAKLLASLNHPNIAAIHGLEEADGTHFLVLELIEGDTLADRLKHGAIPVEESLKLALQIAEALEAAHEKGVIHRDLKPANIKVTPDGKVKVLDFGLAKAFAGDQGEMILSDSPTLSVAATQQGVILGTAAYMSPEQAKGKTVDKRADVWAFGVVLFEMLTGRQLFTGETASETLAAVMMREPDLSTLPPNLHTRIRLLLERCLEKDTKNRYHDIGDARVDIQKALTDSSSIFVQTIPTTKPRKKLGLPWVAAAIVLTAIITGVVVWKLKSSPSPTYQSSPHVEINPPPGDRLATVNSPPVALSPDGHRLVYVAIHNAVQQLFIRSMDTYETRPLPGTEGAECPFFSPDGAWIGFFTTGKLKKISVAGGTATTLCDSGYAAGATWGGDDTIVFSPSANSGLFRVSTNGGESQELTTLDRAKGESSHRWPQFLPGGQALLFTVTTGTGWDDYYIAALRLDTGERHLVHPGGHTGRFVPTGHLVYYRAGALLAVPFDPVRLEVTSSAPELVAEGVNQSASLIGAEYSFSSSGSLAYIPASLRQFERQLVWVDRKGKVEPLPAPVRAYNYQGLFGPSLSPDGQQITFQIQSGTREIWIYDISRDTLTQLTTGSGSNHMPIWTPDGTRVTYLGMRAGFRNIYWKNADGTGEEEQLTTGENQQLPSSWSPDGKWLAFSEENRASSYDIWILGINGERKQQPFLQTQFLEVNGQFSPDGRWLAYVSNESGQEEIYVQPFPGPGPKYKISTEGGNKPLWARNSGELFYRNGDKMMAVAIKTQPAFTHGEPRFLFDEQYGSGDVTPDGQRFLMVRPVEPEQPATKINLVFNWFEELKDKVPVD